MSAKPAPDDGITDATEAIQARIDAGSKPAPDVAQFSYTPEQIPIYVSECRQAGLLSAADALLALSAERDAWKKLSACAIAADNPSVMEYMKHWEGRTLKAEAEVERLRGEVAALKARKQRVRIPAKREERGPYDDER